MSVVKELPPRQAVPLEQTWNKESVFPSADAWQTELEQVRAEVAKLAAYAGRLHESAATLADYLEAGSLARRRILKLRFYAMMSMAVDAGDNAAKAMSGQALAISAQYSAASAFLEPEILAMDEAQLRGWLAEDARLGVYAHALDDVLRQKAHVRSTEVEELLGLVEESFAGPAQISSELSNTDLEFAAARTRDGEEVAMGQGAIMLALRSTDRMLRATAWESYSDSYLRYRNTFAATYLTSVKQNVFKARTRRYASTLEAALDPFNLPVEVFHNLIAAYRANLPTWHRYWEVKRRALGVDALRPYDIWAPLVDDEPAVPFEQAVDWIATALEPLGSEYTAALRRGCLEQRWVDYALNKGKRQGAFSGGSYDTYPFIMMSYDNGLGGMSTLAHELGHSMHSYFSRRTQPEVYASYSLFVAEVASNFNQAMTRTYLFSQRPADDRSFQIALIEEAMSNFHRYFFLMPTLARFEFEVHSRAEAGKPLNADILGGIMSEYFAEGYGSTLADDPQRSSATWMQFGHLYVPYYTFQYATGISAAHALAADIQAGQAGAAERYLNFLKAGSSLYPLDALALAGVDMRSSESVEKTYAVLAELVTRLEGLIA